MIRGSPRASVWGHRKAPFKSVFAHALHVARFACRAYRRAMPWFSYHGGHSGQFCRHAKGELEAVVERAIATGFTHYGLSEHCPRYRSEDLFPGEEDLGPAGL